MANDKTNPEEIRKELISFMQQKGYIWGPSPEIYGGIAGFYTYAPLGKLLKNNIEQVIRCVFQKNDFWEVECPTVLPKIVWEASGHLSGFNDPIIRCSKCESSFRADTLVEEKFPDVNAGKMSDDELAQFMKKHEMKCPSCAGKLTYKIKRHSLMMKTIVGLDQEAYNRPETATTSYLPFIRYVDFFRKKLPFGIFQIGKAYRNEISPRQHLLRCREFTQAESQLFIFDAEKKKFAGFKAYSRKKYPLWTYKAQDKGKAIENVSLADAIKKKYLKNKAYAWSLAVAYEIFLSFGIPSDKMRLRQHTLNERAFYADDAWDLEIELNSFGWTECCGIHDRTNYDLGQHSKFSKKELKALDLKNKKHIPHVLEIAFGTDRPVFALLDLFYEKKEKEKGKTIFKVPYHMAPIKAGVFPLLNKNGMPELAKKVFDDLSKEFLCVYDKAGAIGRRYLRAAEQGIPYCITIDFDSLKKKDCTIRDRNTERQKRVKLSKLKEVLRQLLSGELKFSKL